MSPEERKRGQSAARAIIKRIDGEGKYVPAANYELTGKRLREALELAWYQGFCYGLDRKTQVDGTERKDYE